MTTRHSITEAGRVGARSGDTSLSHPIGRHVKVTAVLTCHNRQEATVACLRSFFSQSVPSSVSLDAVVVDDASSDETVQAVGREFPMAHVVRGPGDLYWAGGMALAERSAEARGADFVLWLNDDVTLDEDAVERLLAVAFTSAGPTIVVGAMRDPLTGEVTYSAVRRRGRHPLRVELVPPVDEPQVVEMFNGNAVLVSQEARGVVGAIDGQFSHAQADFDYGLRAAGSGVLTLLAPGVIGTCSRDGRHTAPWLERSISLDRKVRLLLARKGLPPRSSARYLRRHGGRVWVVWWMSPYLKFAIYAFRDLLTRSRK
jgi:GT2 family glycosyltransferase